MPIEIYWKLKVDSDDIILNTKIVFFKKKQQLVFKKRTKNAHF